MGEHRKALILFLILFSLLVAIPEVKVSKAESRTLVVPDDYPTVEAAVYNASEGDTVFVKKGTYDGPINQTLVINKAISLIGEDPETTILNLRPPWVFQGFDSPMVPVYGYDNAIKIQADDVEISGFTIKGEDKIYVSGRNTKISNNIQIYKERHKVCILFEAKLETGEIVLKTEEEHPQ